MSAQVKTHQLKASLITGVIGRNVYGGTKTGASCTTSHTRFGGVDSLSSARPGDKHFSAHVARAFSVFGIEIE